MHNLKKTSDGYTCLDCGWGWKYKPSASATCPKVPRFTWGIRPDGLFSKTEWAKRGYILLANAQAKACVLRGDQNAYCWLYDQSQVEPGKHKRSGYGVTRQALETEFKRLKEFYPDAELDDDPDSHCYIVEFDFDEDHKPQTRRLSGGYAGGRWFNGSRQKALENLKRWIETEQKKQGVKS